MQGMANMEILGVISNGTLIPGHQDIGKANFWICRPWREAVNFHKSSGTSLIPNFGQSMDAAVPPVRKR